MTDIGELSRRIIQKRSEVPAERAMLVGISGIDASGKGYVASRLQTALRSLRTVVINVDGWLTLPSIRFSKISPADNFYQNGLRLHKMFSDLVEPLVNTRSIDLTMAYLDETATAFRKHRYYFSSVDIVIVEGIFIFKKAFADRFDLRVWINASFKTALYRAVMRSQEGLKEASTIEAYRSIYFPAQLLHFERDRPAEAVDIVFENEGSDP